jgi:inhibitor of cysteine peptidase
VSGMDFLSLARVTALVGACFMYSTGAVPRAYAEKASKAMLSLVETDNGRTVDIALGDTVQVTLPENATTGYRWAVDRYDEEFIELLGTEPRYTANAVGSGGTVAFTFQGKMAGTGEVALKHWRHWEGDSSVTNRFRIRLRVQP